MLSPAGFQLGHTVSRGLVHVEPAALSSTRDLDFARNPARTRSPPAHMIGWWHSRNLGDS